LPDVILDQRFSCDTSLVDDGQHRYSSARIGVVPGGSRLFLTDFLANRVVVLDCQVPVAPTPAPGLVRAVPKSSQASISGLNSDHPLLVFPNPASSFLRVGFYLSDPAAVRLVLSDVSGTTVKVLSLGEQPEGQGIGEFDLSGLSSGLYFVALQVDSGTGFKVKAIKKAAVLR
jgi:hypothetical protein